MSKGHGCPSLKKIERKLLTLDKDRDGLLIVLGLTKREPLWVILCRLPEKGRKELEEIVEEMKDRNREERGTGMKGKKQKK